MKLFKAFLIVFTWLLSNSLLAQNTKVYSRDKEQIYPEYIQVDRNILVENYFQFMDSLVTVYDSITSYTLTEHLLVRNNPWIIDTLQNTDYYRMKARDSFVYNQKKMIVIPKGNRIRLPDSHSADSLNNVFNHTQIDINIPEFKLRIFHDAVKMYEFPIRVGRNEKKFLEMSGREEDLRTKTGTGSIVGYNKDPRYANPANNHDYTVTRRDDKKITLVPQIPFIETELNGIRYGQMIHPTTNPETLGKAYSNGCIGTKEADAWVIYYYAPVNAKVTIRYDLRVLNENGDIVILKDIYGYQ
ncbi:L,D-transpeptidase [Aestuariibaculum lutulentum]|uniref:L,D-transpeptidase n=1 Tax=Aestuariibaculum lutulentum TaxID=2920935 RepID=A0ABS9RLR0_9FLAO|nr:L,D-transpeptidase [Aestuariibaculum lutulentum]MCH4553870.1 L,D-transpeptidase [Aestuariibaculum lutulentum]